jgi:hypothetical protein
MKTLFLIEVHEDELYGFSQVQDLLRVLLHNFWQQRLVNDVLKRKHELVFLNFVLIAFVEFQLVEVDEKPHLSLGLKLDVAACQPIYHQINIIFHDRHEKLFYFASVVSRVAMQLFHIGIELIHDN